MTPNGPSSVESDNNVIVEAVHLPHDDLLTSFVFEKNGSLATNLIKWG